MNDTAFSPPGLLTKREAANFLKIKPRTLDSWLKRRRVPFIKLGPARNATVRFRQADLEVLINHWRVESIQN